MGVFIKIIVFQPKENIIIFEQFQTQRFAVIMYGMWFGIFVSRNNIICSAARIFNAKSKTKFQLTWHNY